MHAIDGQAPFVFPRDADNVVDVSFYRRWRKLRRPLGAATPSRRNGPSHAASEPDFVYLKRMQVNAAAFAFIVVLVLIGIWLIDGLSEAPHHLA